MSQSHTQRYKLVAEDELRDQGDYEWYRRRIQHFFESMDREPSGFQLDFLSIEKVQEADPNGTRK